MKAVTTFSPDGWKLYGERFLRTFLKYWDIPITIYYEVPVDFEHPRVTWKSLYEIPGIVEFLTLAERMQRGRPKHYLYDAFKFARKSFAQMDSFGGKVVWLDADIVTHKDVPTDYIESLTGGEFCAYLGRDAYTETGFILFDCDHPDFNDFERRYKSVYKDGILFTLPYWTDCHAFDWARNGKGKDLTRGKGVNHVFVDFFGDYMDHLKGNRKLTGVSPEWKKRSLLVVQGKTATI